MKQISILEEIEDKPRDECGVFGIYGHPDAGAITAEEFELKKAELLARI